MSKPNIILIIADQFRGDCLSSAGHADVHTPYIDSLAASGVSFDRAYSACPTCIAARAALHTGMDQRNHGRVGYRDGVEWRYEHTLAGELSRGGYYTQCVGKMHVHPLRRMLGYNSVELHDGYLHYYRHNSSPSYEDQRFTDDYLFWLRDRLGASRALTDTGIDCNSWLTRPWPYEENLHPTNWVTDRAIDFFRRRDRDMPFFLTVSYVRPHPPFDAPACFFDMYKDRVLTPPLSGDWDDGEMLKRCGLDFASMSGPSSEFDIQRARAGYYACVSHLDNQIGRLLDAMFSYELRGNTLIMFVSDHGEMLCDHMLFRKGYAYESSSRIPLIISGPECGGGISHRLAELRDVMPTLLTAAGLEIPDTVDGSDLLAPSFNREYLHGEHILGEGLSSHWIVTARDKYIWYSSDGREQYFDTVNDREEAHNAVDDPENSARVGQLRDLLIEELTGREEGFTDGEKLIAGRPLKAVLESSLI